jgi:hypothetical protein
LEPVGQGDAADGSSTWALELGKLAGSGGPAVGAATPVPPKPYAAAVAAAVPALLLVANAGAFVLKKAVAFVLAKR